MLARQVDQIKQTVTIADVLSRYGFEVNSKNTMACPFHSEKTPSFKVYPDSNSFYCFGCGEGGDVLDFVRKMEDCDFKTAIDKLGGNVEMTFLEKRQIAKNKQRQNKLKRERERKKKRYYIVLDEWVRLDINLRKYKPKSLEEIPHPLFVEALKKIDYQNYLLDCIDEEW